MKKIILTITLIGLAVFLNAQNSFPTSNAIWNMKIVEECWGGYYNCPGAQPHNENVQYRIEGDTTINDILYSKLYCQNAVCGEIREDNQQVWFRMENQEYLLFDFGASEGDTVWHNLETNNAYAWILPDIGYGYSIIQSIAIVDGIKHLYTITNYGNSNEWIEEMGSSNGIFGHLPMQQCLCEEWFNHSLGCFMLNDEIKYISCECDSCFKCPFKYPLRVQVKCPECPNYNFSGADTVTFDYQTDPVDVNLQALPLPYHGYSPFTYHWSTNSETYIIQNTTIYNPTISFLGEVTIFLTVTDFCGHRSSATLTLLMNPLGISNNEISDNISIFPNPAKDIINIETTENIAIKTINIYSIDGKLIEANKYSFNGGKLNISRLTTGSYILNLETDKGKFSKTIIKN